MDCHGAAPLGSAMEGHMARDEMPNGMMMDGGGPMGGMEDELGLCCESGGMVAHHPWESEFATAGGGHHQMQMGPGPILGGGHHMDPTAMGGADMMMLMGGGGDDDGMMEQEWAEGQQEHEAAMMEQVFAANETGADWIGQLDEQVGEEWATDFNNEGVTTFVAEGQPMMSVAEKNKESQFYDFMNKIKTGEIIIDEAGVTSAPADAAAAWSSEFGANSANMPPQGMNSEELENWAKDHLGMMGQQLDENGNLVDDENMMEDEWNEQDEANLEEAYAGAEGLDEFGAEYFAQQRAGMLDDNGQLGEFDPNEMAEMEGAEDWLNEYAEMNENLEGAERMTDYPFDPNNPYLFHDEPFSEGQQLLIAGNVSDAVLAFEAACQKNGKENSVYWQTLGTAQAENEKDMLAITALNTAKQLDPSNLLVHMALAVSHTNEGNHNQALKSLRAWITVHPDCNAVNGFVEGMKEADGGALNPTSALGMLEADGSAMDPNSMIRDFMFVSPSEHKDTVALYEAAIAMNPSDAELYIGMGILFNLSHEYDRAAKALEQALQVRPEDAKLWNKLGATLANGNRSREALNAYDKALDLNPGYVRAQYNLGVSHSNLGEHNQAVRQFLRAIVMQQGGVTGDGEPGSNRSTRELWDVLRMTLNLMERPDLVGLAWKQDCRPFLEEFDLTELMS